MVTYIFETAASLFQSFMGVNFILKFNYSSWRKNKMAVPTLLLIFLVTLVGDFAAPGFSTVISLIIKLIFIGFALIISQKRYIRALLSVCIEQSAIFLIGSSLYVLFSRIMNDYDAAMQGSDNIGRYIYLIIGNLLVYTVLKMILVFFKSDDSLDVKTGLIAFVMSVITLVGLSISMTFAGLPFSKEIETQILILTVVFVLINVILYILIAQIQNLQKSKFELQLLKEKLKFEEDRHNDAAVIWNNVRKVQHDIKQHLTVILCQLEDGKTNECKEYINDLIPSVERMGSLIKSDNKVLDYLINSKLCNIEDAQIVISGSVGDLSDIRDIDLACLMGNILDNAVEAIKPLERKKIELLFMKQNSNRVIICKNSISKSVLAENKDLKSTKTGGESHGYGHIIINKIAEDYNGMVDYFEEDGMFGVQVILPMRDN